MATKSQSMLVEDSDNESINTITTEEDAYDSEQEFDVERILAEKWQEKTDEDDEDGEATEDGTAGRAGRWYYLIKWEGYPLYDATWEGEHKITHREILDHWEECKRNAELPGGEPLFDVLQWQEAWEDHQEDLARKARLREAKRRKRVQIVPDDEGSGSDDELPTTAGSKRKRVSVTSLPKRKGFFAQTIPSPRKRQAVIVSSQGSDVDSLFGEPKQQPTSGKGIKAPAAPSSSRAGDSSAVTSRPKGKATALPASSKPVDTPTAKPKPTVTAARKSAPSAPIATAKRTKNVFTNNNPTNVLRRKQYSKVNVEMPKDSVDTKFRNLSTQNRYQKGGRTEPVPDINALTMVDPKTGKTQQPAATSTRATVPIHSAYRRRTPPQATRRRSRSRSNSPVRPGARQPESSGTGANSTTIGGRAGDGPVGSVAPIGTRNQTCTHWQTGTCQYTADRCPYDHQYIEKKLTCFFWRREGNCRKGDSCKFAHEDTGDYAPPPPGYNTRVDRGIEPREEVMQRPKDEPIAASPAFEVGKRGTTCYFWRTTGSCRMGNQCEFAHHDTGIHAGPPGSFRSRVPSDPNLSGLGFVDVVGQRPPDAQMETARPPPPPAAQMYSAPPPPGTAHPDDAPLPPPPPPPATIQPIKLVSPSVDPRLRRRPSFKTDVARPPPADISHTTPSMDGASDLNVAVKSLNAANSPGPITPGPITPGPNTPGNSEAEGKVDWEAGRVDYEASRRGVKTLNLTELLDVSEGASIEGVFLQIPPLKSSEMQLLGYRFAEFHCKVFSSRTEGHWNFFRSKYSHCLVVLHPSENYRHIPGLQGFISRNSMAKIYSIGVQHRICTLEGREPVYEAHRLFPHGGITFITDDVFVYYPEKATQIIDKFLEKAKAAPPGGHFSKIGARPDIISWVIRLSQQKFKENPDDTRYTLLFDALRRLCPIKYEDVENLPHRSVPLDQAWLWSEDEDSHPDFKDQWERGDEEAATEYMVNLFAGHAIQNAATYRRFIVVHQRPELDREVVDSQGAKEVQQEADPKGWRAKYCHVGVMTADQYLKR
ncbi:uncharacterized protein LTR77_002773 [Saxophila tyrrhenica]|uniref:Chromo domain-containing protein n=1 Tax=Saxophila tyrrhenica TaxID=1690608 RepID=A0AAV9PJV0_9PEZI|nr:hypothetical protein LTR77_002773 [Saxophila tyrrhenica]